MQTIVIFHEKPFKPGINKKNVYIGIKVNYGY